jgi:glutaminyl-peptide cyclotransferase
MTAPRDVTAAASLLLLFACSTANLASVDSPDTAAGAATPRPAFDSTRAFDHVRQLVSIGPRPPGSGGIQQARAYIIAQLKGLGLSPTEQPFDAETPIGPIKMANVIVRLPGARPERLLIGGHYDTKLFRAFRFVGASDGGSSAAMLLELARVLKDRKGPLTIELVFFDGEEALRPDWAGTDHTYGSRHYVAAGRKDGSLSGVKGLILLDMVGDRSLTIRKETRSTTWMTSAIWESARRLGHQSAFLEESFPVEDDHVAFLDAGIPAVDVIDLDYQAWHTAQDNLDAVSARSLQVVGDVVLDALPKIEARLAR